MIEMLLSIAILVFILTCMGIYIMSAALDRLTASVAALATSADAAIAKISATPAGDDAAVSALADQVDQVTSKLDAAVTPTSA